MVDRHTYSYIYDGTFIGLMSAVHEAYYSRQDVRSIAAHSAQQGFDVEVRDIPVNEAHARDVIAAVRVKVSRESLESCYLVHLSEVEQAGTMVYRFLRLAFRHGAAVENMLGDPDVLAVVKLANAVRHEAHLLTGFVRFHIRDGLAFSKIKPKYNVLELIAPHFSARYAEMPFVICDEGRRMAVVYRPHSYEIVEVDEITLPPPDEQETFYRGLWKEFYKSVAVESRTNPRQQRGMMPKYFWRNMLEMEPPNSK